MRYRSIYRTPADFSDLIMSSDGAYLTGLWFEGSRDAGKHEERGEERELPVFQETARWLTLYFEGKTPDFIPAYRINGLTPFRSDVIDVMNTITFGKTMTYGEIAKIIAEKRGKARMSAQAVGGAVGWNPICVIIPCHRVVGAGGTLTGYGGGLANKAALLRHEGICLPAGEKGQKGLA